MSNRNRVRMSLGAAGIGALVLAGCTVPSNDPQSYDPEVQQNFVAGCTGADPIVDNTTSTIASSTVCQCDFAVFVANVPFNDSDKAKSQYAGYGGKTFVEINNEMKRDGTKFNDAVTQDVRNKLNQCATNPTSATLPPGFLPGTTVAGGAGTTSGTASGSPDTSVLR
ncbi:MAG: hypothetical protein HYX32_15445 [Actinobacteria bacterium]|nr:hypothetical protein [Actinomycetota bacterium]